MRDHLRVGIGPLVAPAGHGQVDVPGQFTREVLDVNTCPAVDIRGVLPCQKRDVHWSGGDRVAFPDDDDAPVRDDESPTVRLDVDAHLRARLDDDVLVDDRVSHDRLAADVDTVHQHRADDLAFRVHVHAGGEDRTSYGAAGDDDTGAHERVERVAHATRLVEHELRGWQGLV